MNWNTIRRSRIIRLPALLLLFLLVSCGRSTPQVTPTATRPLPTPQAFTTSMPEAAGAAQVFLDGWKAEDYAGMYALLTPAAQAAITQDDFVKRYTDTANEAGMIEMSYRILDSVSHPEGGQVSYEVTLTSAILGPITRQMQMPLSLDGGQWRVAWNDGLILPELAGGNYLKMDSGQQTRAAILDRSGNPLARETESAAIGVYPDYVNLKDDEGLISLLAQLSNRRYDTISSWIETLQEDQPGSYLPVAELPVDQDPRRLDLLAGWNASIVSRYTRRLYYGSGIGSHLTGYVSPIQEDEVSLYRRKGYRSDERVGRKGLELWGEDTLMGKRGGTLYVFSPDGRPVAELGSLPGEPGQEITTTIDRTYQYEAQKAMSVFTGAAVVLERDTGRVLALVSSPNFDPNAFEIENYNWNTLLGQIVNNPDKPQFNRATQGQYPLGSVFKIITMAAGFESQRYTPDFIYDCQYTFEELPGFTRYDWTWDHFQEDGVTLPSGKVTYLEGLMRSCNPLYWHIGLDLFRVGLTGSISNMARGFGLGSKTGITGVDEEAGNIPDPASEVDAINLAIGQGEMLVTPLQVARFIAAVGNGGTLYRPQIIEKIAPPGGEASFTFQPEAQGTLPLKPEFLAMIQEAMVGVVRNEKPRGTAWRPMSGLDIPLAGKTGTAEAPAGDSHAWFAGYTFANRPDKPDIAVVVIAENAGEGSEIAAPIVRRLIELYFYGKPLKLYRWESAFDATREPTKPVPDTPAAPTAGPNINP
ncbi:MAG: penicillin-binding transpeptidase domain-containing protein [Chloroflexota bacterium]